MPDTGTGCLHSVRTMQARLREGQASGAGIHKMSGYLERVPPDDMCKQIIELKPAFSHKNFRKRKFFGIFLRDSVAHTIYFDI